METVNNENTLSKDTDTDDNGKSKLGMYFVYEESYFKTKCYFAFTF